MPKAKKSKKPVYKRKRFYGTRSAPNAFGTAMTYFPRKVIAYKGIKRFVRVTPFQNITSLDTSSALQKSANSLQLVNNSSGFGIQYASFSLQFLLEDIINYTEFTALFDKFRIRGIAVRLIPFFTSSLTGAAFTSTAAQMQPLLHTIIDHDDVIRPSDDETGLNTIRQYDTYKMMRLGPKIFRRYLVPKAQTIVRGVGTDGYAQVGKNVWLDCATTQIPHYGLKGILEWNNPGSSTLLHIKAEYTAYLEFKDTR